MKQTATLSLQDWISPLASLVMNLNTQKGHWFFDDMGIDLTFLQQPMSFEKRKESLWNSLDALLGQSKENGVIDHYEISIGGVNETIVYAVTIKKNDQNFLYQSQNFALSHQIEGIYERKNT